MSEKQPEQSCGTREPPDNSLFQQRMKAWHPILDPVWVVFTLIIIGGTFVPVGMILLAYSDSVVEHLIMYDSHEGMEDAPCGIRKANENKECNLTFQIDKAMEKPVLVYYEIDNFYQTHREYAVSRDDEQLLGNMNQNIMNARLCDPLNKLGNITINPCGLIANTFFNDVFQLIPTDDQEKKGMELTEDGIAWQSDLEFKFRQPDTFRYEECDCYDCQCTYPEWSCKELYEDPKTKKCFRYFYPNDNTTQYLYETYNNVISPIDGVTNEHFIVWMRLAAKPNFRKLYGYIDMDIEANQTLSFNIQSNWDVKRFKGSKSLVLTTTTPFGGKNSNLGNAFFYAGIIALAVSLLFSLKLIIKPRRLASDKYLKYKED